MKILYTRKKHECAVCKRVIPTNSKTFAYRDFEEQSNSVCIRRYAHLPCARQLFLEKIIESV